MTATQAARLIPRDALAPDPHRAWQQGPAPLRLGHVGGDRRRHRYTGTLPFYRCWTPGPVPLARLIAVAQARWKIEEDHQLARQVAGLDSGQVLR